MRQRQIPNVERRQRVLLVAHRFDADFSMESRLSWFRAKSAAKKYDVTVLCAENNPGLRCDPDSKPPGVNVVTVPHSAFEKWLTRSPVGFHLAYRLWHLRVFQVAKRLHTLRPFSLAHQVSYCGFREPGYCWRLGIPFVWGPIGGTQNVPKRFLSQFSAFGATKELCRSMLNVLQLRMGWRVGKALQAASKVFVANREIQTSFRQARGVELSCQLETGVERCTSELREPRELHDTQQPLRVLWAGRLENWKALPLLLNAVAQLPKNIAIELRIVGSGSQERYLKGLAERLGLENRLDWVPLPDCGARLEHYLWADVFAFTSLRDTSGTGLLESLAAGVPIIGLDHQGARDIMTKNCAVPISVKNPQQVISDTGKALTLLAGDSKLLRQLSDGALTRAQKYQWERLGTEMNEAYAKSLRTATKLQVQESNREEAPQSAAPVAG